MKSISIKTKLAILVIIPLIAALIVTVLGLFYVNKISSNLTQSLYNEGFQSISLVLNADRDLYQALDSVNGLLMENSKGVLDPASKEEFIAGYEENAVQTSDRVKEAVDLLSENKEFWSEIKDDSGANVFDHYASFEENFAKWEEMSAGITTTYVSTEEWTAQFDSSREDMNVIGELVEVGIQKSITDNEASKTDMVTMMILIDVVVLALVLFLSIFIIRAITIPLKKSVTMLQEMVKGRLSHRLNLNQKDEIGIMADTLDQYAENLQLNVIGTMKKISEGDLNMDIQITDSEDEISPVMKLTVDNLKALVSEAEMLTAAAMEGNLSARGNADAFQGGYYHILAGVNSTLDSVIGPLNVAADYMDRISKGDIPPVITDEYHGDFDQIKNNINTCINAINSLVEDMDILSIATVKGDLLVRNDAGKHSGDFAKIVEGVNLTLDTLVGFIDEMPAPVMIINNDYDIQYMNKIGSSILGKTQSELTGQKCYDNFKTSHCRTENCSCARAMKLDDKVTAETDAHPTGMDLEISYTGRPIKDRNNNIIGAVELIVDQTDIKRAAKLAEKQAEYQLVEVERLIYNLEKISVGDLDLSLKIGEVDEDTAIVGQNFEKINSSLSQSVDALKSMMEDVNMLAQAAVEGRLDTRADAAHHQGDYRKIVEGVNGTLNAVIEPIKEASEVLQEMAKGNLKVGMFGNYQGDLDDLKTALNQTISSMVTYMTEIATVLTKMGQGNLNQAITADYRGDFVVMKESLNGILESLNDVLGDINEAAEQVASGSRQVSDGSQALSQGSTEQASSIQELTASIIELADQTKQNAVNANQASTLAETAKSNAERGNDQMKEMLTSMSDINDSSANISKIIKVIDDIAFQTNILALNAAVEAARAGQHGKGFAVVAEEVRNLAARSADAAKETTALIEGSINKVQTGTKIANETAAALIEIVDGIEKSASLISNIAESSNNQASGISQINRGIEQVSQVVQNNAATAEESAASSEELSSQAELLKQMVGRFELNGAKALKNAGTKLLGSSTPRAAAVSDYQILLSDDEFDKY